MERYDVKVPKQPEKQIRDIHLPWRDRIKRAIDFLAQDPFAGGKMKGEFEGRRKLVVWPYRIFYCVLKDQKVIVILKVKHRGSAGYA
jgi:mRNA-degrading endonuclease RelE of RelBE toxin-antitoxin system